MPRRLRFSRFRPSPQVQFPDSVQIQRYEYPSSVYSYPPSPYDGGGLVTDGKKRLERKYSVKGLPPAATSTKENENGYWHWLQTPIATK
ncbi:hypothetical protein COP2_008844 [Malus domestica]|uniref:Uncharacterized protein n=1 Tax=Malus domestica TaxID=3750 RepID=A0A498IH90_MALDO|nr:hypothetical protein DVH24_034926 [Malus domestica]